MTYKQSIYSKAFREFVRQVKLLSRPGLVKTWRAWEDQSSSDDSPATSMLPWVRITPAGATSERTATNAGEADFYAETVMSVVVETIVPGYGADASMDLWGELREAFLNATTATRNERDEDLLDVCVIDVIETQPVVPNGPQSWGVSGQVRAQGQLELVIVMGA